MWCFVLAEGIIYKVNCPNLGQVLIWINWRKTVNRRAQKERKTLP